MKTFKSSDLSHNRADVLKAAREGGVIIEERRSNGEVIAKYVLQQVHNVVDDVIVFNEPVIEGRVGFSDE